MRDSVRPDHQAVNRVNWLTARCPQTYNLQSLFPTQAPSHSRVSSQSEPGRLGHWKTIHGCSCRAWSLGWLRQSASVCTIASAHCAQRVSLPSAELELMIRVSPRPRIFGGGPSASVRGSQEFLRICVRRRTRPPPHISGVDITGCRQCQSNRLADCNLATYCLLSGIY